jgi:nitroimidazol reductase NimA-like FMN-containing flavoprotein (pyridoxamine 5'-phosphate oxidase superfamily)
MIIQEISREECYAALAHMRLGRLACAREGQPYVVPCFFAYERSTLDEDYLYSFSSMGQKIEWMRGNPLVCVELDEVTNLDQWTSIVVFGHYEELPACTDELPLPRGVAMQQSELASERHHAWQLLKTYPMWWEPGSSAHAQVKASQALHWVFYRIRIDRITGRRAVPSPDGPAQSRTLSLSRVSPGWLRRVIHALSKPLRGGFQ